MGDRPGRRRRRRFARQRLGVPSPSDDPGRRESRVAQSAAGGVLHSRAGRPGVRPERQVPSGVGRARARATNGSPPQHGIFVDDKDNVWLSGSAKEDNQILKFTSTGKFLMQIGHAGKNKGSNDTENLGGPAGLFVLPEDQRAVRRRRLLQPPRHRVRRGRPARTSVTGAPTARSPTTTTSSRRARSSLQGPPPAGSTIPCTPSSCRTTTSSTSPTAPTTGSRCSGSMARSSRKSSSRGTRSRPKAPCTTSPLSPDKEQQFLYVVDGSNKAIRVLNRQTLEIVSNVGGHAGHNAREFFHATASPPTRRAISSSAKSTTASATTAYAFKGMGR